MYEVKLNQKKNAIMTILKGRMELEETQQFVKKYKEGIDQLSPGFALINDVTEFIPSTEEVREILKESMVYAIAQGVKRCFRIVSGETTAVVSNIQFNRTARELGYTVEEVRSLDEAKQKLGW